ncbi:phospholipase A2 inhibitor 1-like [Engystomops pustulosus]|uniref:phospholipase A2 inhibitor 1-like n=1 Tax=Engystomops pustulosus TaxID=76066 RepID=UPI003AFAC924
MKPVIISVFLLSFFHSIECDLDCYKCKGRNHETCQQTVVKCAKGQSCMTISEECIVNGTHHSVWKGCSGNMPCNEMAYSRVNKDVSIRSNIQCCDKNQCNDQFYQMPKEGLPQGPKCPSCFKFDSTEECVPDNITACQGIDDKCVTFVGTIEKPDKTQTTYTMKGCMSSVGCNLELDEVVGCRVLEEKIFRCVDPTSKLPNDEAVEKEKIALVPGTYA